MRPNRAVTRMTARRVDEICDLVRSGVPLAEWPADFFRVEDNIRPARPAATASQLASQCAQARP
jgi:hypothetical protein